jgi:ribosomal protein L15
MTFSNGKNDDIIKRRREAVGRLRVYGMTEAEITVALPKQGIVNPRTRKPFTNATVHGDIVALREEWQANAAESTAVHQARQLAEIQAIKRQAFLDRDGLLALRAIDREIKILGTAAPDKVEIKVNIEVVTRAWTALEKAGKDPELVFGRLAEQAERVQ